MWEYSSSLCSNIAKAWLYILHQDVFKNPVVAKAEITSPVSYLYIQPNLQSFSLILNLVYIAHYIHANPTFMLLTHQLVVKIGYFSLCILIMLKINYHMYPLLQ